MVSLIKIDLQHILSEKFGMPVSMSSINSVGGGSINETAKIKTGRGIFFCEME